MKQWAKVLPRSLPALLLTVGIEEGARAALFRLGRHGSKKQVTAGMLGGNFLEWCFLVVNDGPVYYSLVINGVLLGSTFVSRVGGLCSRKSFLPGFPGGVLCFLLCPTSPLRHTTIDLSVIKAAR